ncbi:uncharacterized protein [Rutidosis leptorrhynchoides]
MCEKTAYHMCYTCTYSLCKGCIKTSDYVCVRGDKGFCTVCMKMIMLIENKGDATAKVDFDDKNSWEYLFKVYWVYLKQNLSLTLDDLTQAKNPWKISTTATIGPTISHITASGRRSITSELALANLEANESKRKKTDEETNGEQCKKQKKIDEFAAIDVHNMNLIYLKRKLMESLIEDSENFSEKVAGSIVQIKISGSDQKDDMYRLVQVVGTIKVDVPYKIGDKSVDVMLEVLNLDKKEKVSIDIISNQELSEDECRRLRESIRCGLVRCFTVGEIQEKATALQPVLIDDRMETEMQQLSQLRDHASQKGQKRGLKDCLKKLQLLKTPEERERRLREIPEVHSDPKMNPDYESDDTEEYFNNEQGEHQKPKFPWVSGRNTITSKKRSETLKDQPTNSGVTTYTHVKEHSIKVTEQSNTEKDVHRSSSPGRPPNEGGCNVPTISKCNPEATVSSSLSNNVSESAPSAPVMSGNPSVNDNVWHYRDPSGNVQGPFSIVQLQKWSTSGYFPADMMIWAGREADSLLLNKVLQEQFHKDNDVACDTKVGNESESISVSSPVPPSTIPATSYAINSVNLDKLPDNLDSNPPTVASLPETNESTKPFDTQIMPDINQSTKQFDTEIMPDMNQSTKQFDTEIMPDINQVSSVFTGSEVSLVDLPSPVLKKESHENEKIQVTGNKDQSKLLVQDSANAPNWSTTLSLVIGGTQLPETPDEWGRYPPAFVKPGGCESGRVSDHQVATTNTTMDQVTTSNSTMDQVTTSNITMGQVPTSNSTMDHVIGLPSWNGLGETIEFSTLAEESVSDLLAEVDAMESRNGGPSPTSRRNSFLEDLFNGSIDDFSPTTDQCTRSDGFSSTVDIQVGRESTGLQFSFGLETKSTCDVSIPQTTSSDNMGIKWSETGGSELQPPRQDMIDLNDSTRAEADEGELETRIKNNRNEEKSKYCTVDMPHNRAESQEGERETKIKNNRIEEKSKCHTVVMAHHGEESRQGRKSKVKEGEYTKPEVARMKARHVFSEAEEGEFILPEDALPPPPPPPPPQPLPPLLPLPPPPPTTTGLDVVDSRRAVSGRPCQVTTSTGRVHSHTSASRSENVSRDSHHRRSSGGRDRYTSISPRERGHHVEDSGYSRNSRSSWSRQSSFGSSGGNGSGYSRSPSFKGQRVCKFYESGRCKKGSACNYLHPQDR